VAAYEQALAAAAKERDVSEIGGEERRRGEERRGEERRELIRTDHHTTYRNENNEW